MIHYKKKTMIGFYHTKTFAFQRTKSLKSQDWEWENILTNHLCEMGLISRTYGQSARFNILKLNNPKKSKRFEKTHYQKRYMYSRYTHEHVFSILRGNANINYNEINERQWDQLLLHAYKMSKIKRQGSEVLARIWKNWNSHTLLMRM